MASVLLVFSGVSFSHTVLDKGIAWAKEHQAHLVALFLQEDPVDEGYGFPSDIDSAENLNNEEDAHEDDITLLQGKIKMIQKRADEAQVDRTIRVSADFSEESMLATADDIALVLVDAGTAEEPADNELPFSPAKLTEKATCPVELIKNQ
jgi:hypothetical protein